MSLDAVYVYVLYTFFVLYSAITLTWTPSVEHGFPVFVRLSSVCVILILVPSLLVENRKDLQKLTRLVLYFSVLYSTLIIFAYLSPEYGRPFEITGVGAHIAPGRIIGIGLPISLFYLLYSQHRSISKRAVYVLLAGFILVAVGVSESRGPLLASLAAAIAVITYHPFSRNSLNSVLSYLYACLILVPVIGLVVSRYSLPTLDRVLMILRGKSDRSFDIRIEYYREAIYMWADSPIIGNGLAGFHAEAGNYPHNFLLEIGSGLGLTGVILFLSIIAVSARSLFQCYSDERVLIFSILMYGLINASFSFNLPAQRHLFFAFGLSISLYISARSEN